MVKCSFCENMIPRGTGTMFVKNDGKIFNFCSHRCEMNMFKLNRKPHLTKWTVTYHKQKKSGEKAEKTK
ncbi:ribosomal protein L24e family protein [Candidatus Woesearchaeota archaeon]|nr:ribosomal protein L24e family protein [Candidatus Woesearchaeota archaeon]